MCKVDFKLYLITDRHLCNKRQLVDVLKQAQSAGVKAIQLREKDLASRQLYNFAKELRSLCPPEKVRLFVNDRVDIARAISACGVQLTATSLPISATRTVLKKQSLIGVSTHSLAEVEQATLQQCDFILFGPVFSTPAKINYGRPQGLAKLETVTKSTALPVFAVGGIGPKGAKQCLEHGAYGVAAISAILKAENIEETIRRFEENLGKL